MPRCARSRHGRAQLAGADRVDADGRLVEEQHLGLVQQAAGDVQPLPHAARVALDPLLLAAGRARPARAARRCAAFCSRGRDAVQLGEVAQVVQPGQPLVEPAVAAEDVADPPAYLARRPSTTSCPSTRAVPEVGSSSVMSILIVVVLPAPFGPSSPNSSPRSTVKSTPRTASTSFVERWPMPVRETYERRRSATSMTGSVIGRSRRGSRAGGRRPCRWPASGRTRSWVPRSANPRFLIALASAVDSGVTAGTSANDVGRRDLEAGANDHSSSDSPPGTSRQARALRSSPRSSPVAHDPRVRHQPLDVGLVELGDRRDGEVGERPRKAGRLRRIVIQDSPDWNASRASRSNIRSSPRSGWPHSLS